MCLACMICNRYNAGRWACHDPPRCFESCCVLILLVLVSLPLFQASSKLQPGQQSAFATSNSSPSCSSSPARLCVKSHLSAATQTQHLSAPPSGSSAFIRNAQSHSSSTSVKSTSAASGGTKASVSAASQSRSSEWKSSATALRAKKLEGVIRKTGNLGPAYKVLGVRTLENGEKQYLIDWTACRQIQYM